MKIGAFAITKKNQKVTNEWVLYLVKREKKFTGPKKIRKRNETFITVPKSKNSFNLAYNGKRFANGPELKSLEKCFPKISIEVKAAIMGGKI